jgi:hypothetical protein
VIKKPREGGGHSLRWAAKPEKIIILLINLLSMSVRTSKGLSFSSAPLPPNNNKSCKMCCEVGYWHLTKKKRRSFSEVVCYVKMIFVVLHLIDLCANLLQAQIFSPFFFLRK